ncbi:MAG: Crp/Fnr family transcriptional regulator [Terriglobales bacterium]
MQPKTFASSTPPPASNGPDLFIGSTRTNWEGRPIRNRLLLTLPDAEFQPLRSFLTFQQLPHHAILHEPRVELEYVYFPNRGLISILVATKEGKTVAVAMVGHEGVVGAPAVIGLTRFPYRTVVQIAGDGFRVRVDALEAALSASPALQSIAIRYAVLEGMQAAQSAACNRLHRVEQRLARWLLIMQGRADRGSLQVTHDFLATMLGTDRPSVSLAAGVLQRKGAIEYTRGAVRIADRLVLEEATCECYTVMRQLNEPLGIRLSQQSHG